jgi:hypothetical protein
MNLLDCAERGRAGAELAAAQLCLGCIRMNVLVPASRIFLWKREKEKKLWGIGRNGETVHNSCRWRFGWQWTGGMEWEGGLPKDLLGWSSLLPVSNFLNVQHFGISVGRRLSAF